MDWYVVGLLFFGGLLVIMTTGMPVVVAFLVVSAVGAYLFMGGVSGFGQLFFLMMNSVQRFTLLPMFFFIVLGEVLFQSGIAQRAINVIDIWLGRLPGRLSLLAVGSGVIIACLSGSGLGSAGLLAATLTPEMEARGYKKPMSLGPILGSSGIAIIIPPSSGIIFIAALAETSVGRLLMAGVLPGVLMGFFYACYIIGRSVLQPHLAPPYYVPTVPLVKKVKATGLNVIPIAVIIFLVIGVILLGIATPSEAAAMGALGAFLLAAAYRCLNWKVVKTSFLASIRITVMIFAILLGAVAFGQILAFSGVSRGLMAWITGLAMSPITVVIYMMLLVLFMGCFISGIAIMVMLIPLYMPVIHALGVDPVWFCLLFLLNGEMGLTSPPYGLINFVVKAAAPPDTTLGDIYRAGLPFLGCDAIVMALIIAFPAIALWLPSVMVTT